MQESADGKANCNSGIFREDVGRLTFSLPLEMCRCVVMIGLEVGVAFREEG